LLALKLIVEEIPPERAAELGGVAVHVIDEALAAAADKGILLAPRSRLVRDTAAFHQGARTPDRHTVVRTFTLQWHITQACDLHCKHCYDRSDRAAMTLEQGLRVLQDMRTFCRDRRVGQHVCFTGGNPLLHPHFLDLYRAAAAQGAVTSVLGNPASDRQIEQLLEVQRPRFFQVSLEGLREHNDAIRGAGHFERTMEFLALLRRLGVNSAVMLTLTADNVDQVLPLAELLRGRADYFTFNRLSPVGEGAQMRLPSRERYAAFLEEYVEASLSNPTMGLKDNLLNIVLEGRGMEVSGGCTGFGCGAAFNFLAVLPDGEAHACRKFPSPVGNVLEEGIAAVYDGEPAARYRRGAAACAGCRLRPVCGGCLASARGFGLDFFRERDPMCFVDEGGVRSRSD
jgi:selenobiotic family peptide radical SAM maturase